MPNYIDPLTRYDVDSAGCWIWNGPVSHEDYGVVAYRIEGKKTSSTAHRYFYRKLVGEVDRQLQIDHLCRVRRCVNPDHLEPVTPAENNRRAVAAMTHFACGHEVTVENTLWAKGRKLGCRTCWYARGKAWREANREKYLALHRARELKRYHAKKAAA